MADVSRLPGPNADIWDWQMDAACRGEDSDVFFHPEGERGPSRVARERAAKAICARCPVSRKCLDFALETGVEFGVYGGTTPDERKALVSA